MYRGGLLLYVNMVEYRGGLLLYVNMVECIGVVSYSWMSLYIFPGLIKE